LTVNKKSIIAFRIFSDLILLNISFYATYIYILDNSSISVRTFNVLLILNAAWLITARFSKLYDDFRSRTFSFLFISIVTTSIYFLLFMIVGYFLFREYFVGRPRIFVVIFSTFLNFSIILKEFILRKVLNLLRKKGKNIRNMVIIGAGELGNKFSNLIDEHPHFGYKILGFLCDKGQHTMNGKYLGKLNELEKVLNKFNVHEVVVALPDNPTKPLDEILRLCNKYAVRVNIIPDYMRFLSKKFQTSTFGEFPIITVRAEPLEEIQWRVIKRGFDIIFSLFVIITICSWLFPIIAILIKIDSKGPVFFTQDRIGQNGKPFKTYKFRSMYSAETNSEGKFTPLKSGDSRITKVGRFLRKTNLDELPQFFNVLIGNMSVVGPRPHAISFEEKYSEFVEEIKLRHLVKPGITGWAQVNGLRGDFLDESKNRLLTKAKINHDIWYIENWSFVLDLHIILLTIWKMIQGKTEGR